MIMAIKNDTTHPSRKARTLVLIADNFMENKNNTVFAGLQDFILLGWFDEVQLLFGPVGHTHNGVDQVHAVHNGNLGQYTIADLGQAVSLYPSVWTDPAKRSEAVLLDASTTGMISISPISAS